MSTQLLGKRKRDEEDKGDQLAKQPNLSEPIYIPEDSWSHISRFADPMDVVSISMLSKNINKVVTETVMNQFDVKSIYQRLPIIIDRDKAKFIEERDTRPMNYYVRLPDDVPESKIIETLDFFAINLFLIKDEKDRYINLNNEYASYIAEIYAHAAGMLGIVRYRNLIIKALDEYRYHFEYLQDDIYARLMRTFGTDNHDHHPIFAKREYIMRPFMFCFLNTSLICKKYSFFSYMAQSYHEYVKITGMIKYIDICDMDCIKAIYGTPYKSNYYFWKYDVIDGLANKKRYDVLLSITEFLAETMNKSRVLINDILEKAISMRVPEIVKFILDNLFGYIDIPDLAWDFLYLFSGPILHMPREEVKNYQGEYYDCPECGRVPKPHFYCDHCNELVIRYLLEHKSMSTISTIDTKIVKGVYNPRFVYSNDPIPYERKKSLDIAFEYKNWNTVKLCLEYSTKESLEKDIVLFYKAAKNWEAEIIDIYLNHKIYIPSSQLREIIKFLEHPIRSGETEYIRSRLEEYIKIMIEHEDCIFVKSQ